MAGQKIYLVRHAESTMRKRYCGSTEASLSLKGVEQAKIVAEYFDSIPLDHCWLSPQKRAKMTARLLLGKKNLQSEADPNLREMNFGSWERKSYASIQERWAEPYSKWLKSPQYSTPPMGEAFPAFRKRIGLFSKKMTTALQENPGLKNILVVAHGGSLSVLTMILLRLPSSQFWEWIPKNASVTILKNENGGSSSRFKILQFNHTLWEN